MRIGFFSTLVAFVVKFMHGRFVCHIRKSHPCRSLSYGDLLCSWKTRDFKKFTNFLVSDGLVLNVLVTAVMLWRFWFSRTPHGIRHSHNNSFFFGQQLLNGMSQSNTILGRKKPLFWLADDSSCSNEMSSNSWSNEYNSSEELPFISLDAMVTHSSRFMRILPLLSF